MNNLKQYAGLLNDEAPKDHFLAYITSGEKDMLVDAGGVKTPTSSGIFAYPPGEKYGGTNSSGGFNDPTPSSPSSSSSSDNSGSSDDNYPSNPPPSNTVDVGFQEALKDPYNTGNVDAEDEYIAPDIDHYKATQKAINNSIAGKGDDALGDLYQADYSDWSKADQDTYQLEMNNLKGTEGKNYSFYSGNEGTINNTFGENWKDVAATNPNIAKFSPTLRFLVAAGKTLKQNATTDYGTGNYGGTDFTGGGSGEAVDGGGWLGKIFNSDGSVNTNITETEANDLYKEAQNDLPFLIGGTEKPKSMVNNYFANMGSNLGVSSAYMDTYNAAKANITKTLNLPTNNQQYGYGNTFNQNFDRSMTSANPFFDELTTQGLI